MFGFFPCRSAQTRIFLIQVAIEDCSTKQYHAERSVHVREFADVPVPSRHDPYTP